MAKSRFSPMFGAAVLMALSFSTSAFAADAVANKVYAVNVLTSFGTSFTDCFRFTDTTFSIDGCGDSGPFKEIPISGLSGVTGWGATISCGGLNLVWMGTSVDGAPLIQGADVVGSTAIGKTQGTTFSVNGLGTDTCPLAIATNGINYTRPDLAPTRGK